MVETSNSNQKVFYSAALLLRVGFFSKNEKKKGILLEDDPNLYYTAELKDSNRNDAHPFSADGKMASEWFSIDLRTVMIKPSKTEAKFSLQDLKDGSTKATFYTEAVSSANAWASMLNVVKENAMLNNKPKFNLNSTNASSSLELTSEIE